MIPKEHVLVMDVDGTLCSIKRDHQSYDDVEPEPRMIARLREMSAQGWTIILHSSRGMRTHDGNQGAINATVLPTLLAWLKRHDVPFNEVYMGKPWAGHDGFYVDDRSVRPREFLSLSLEELDHVCGRDRLA